MQSLQQRLYIDTSLLCSCLRCASYSACCVSAWALCALLALVLALAVLLPAVLVSKDSGGGDDVLVRDPFVSGDFKIEERLREGSVTLLDARRDPEDPPINGVKSVLWDSFVNDGTLKPPQQLADVFTASGVTNTQAVVVMGDWDGDDAPGDQGRIWWLLHWLGHEEAYILPRGDAGLDVAAVNTPAPAAVCTSAKPPP